MRTLEVIFYVTYKKFLSMEEIADECLSFSLTNENLGGTCSTNH